MRNLPEFSKALNHMHFLFRRTVIAAALFSLPMISLASLDDDAPYRGDGKPNAVQPVQGGRVLADFPTNAEPTIGLRILPPTGTQLIRGQRFDLRVET